MWWSHFCNRRQVRVNAEISIGDCWHLLIFIVNQVIGVSKQENRKMQQVLFGWLGFLKA